MLREAALAAPTNWPTWRRYIAELDRADRRVDALRELRTFLDRQSFRGESWAMLGDLLAKEHDYPRALAVFTCTRRGNRSTSRGVKLKSIHPYAFQT